MTKKRKRSVGSVAQELVAKSRESALCAIRIFNDPHVSFKSETFIVLMVIAWTYLLHAFFRREHIEYRYYSSKGKRKIFERTKRGEYKYWELERCLDEKACPLDRDTANNLRFLIGLRHKIEHQMAKSLDNYLSGRYQACALNYNTYIKNLFHERYTLDTYLTYSIQFVELAEEQVIGTAPKAQIPEHLLAYIAEFDKSLTKDEFNDSRFSVRYCFQKKMVNRPGQADRVVEFIDPHSEHAKDIQPHRWVKKEVERPKYRPSHVVKEVKKAGFSKFRVNPEHVAMWKGEDAKNPGKGYGIEVEGVWYWYKSWVDRCIELCKAAGEKYK